VRITEDAALRRDLSRRARTLAAARHDVRKVRADFQSAIAAVARAQA
jgi:hypothetical protein